MKPTPGAAGRSPKKRTGYSKGPKEWAEIRVGSGPYTDKPTAKRITGGGKASPAKPKGGTAHRAEKPRPIMSLRAETRDERNRRQTFGTKTSPPRRKAK